MKRYFLGFKIYYLVYLLLAFNAFINESLWMEYATDLLAVLGVGCALCMLKDWKQYQKVANLRLIGLFLISYMVSAVLNYRYGVGDNVKELIWMFLFMVVLYATSAVLSMEERKKEFRLLACIWVIYSCLLYTSEGYSDNTKVIYSHDIKSAVKNESKNVNVNDCFSVYISGIDVYGAIETNSRSDVNIIAEVNPTTHQILLITTPRDYYVEIPGISGGQKDKLTHAGIYGVDASMSTLEQLYDTNLDFYARVNFTSLIDIVDALGGVDVDSEYAFTTSNDSGLVMNVVQGTNHFNGKQALAFSRERQNVPGGDNQRGKDQQAVLTAMIKKMVSPAILTGANGIITSVSGNVDTNMSMEQIQKLIKTQLADAPKWSIKSMAAEGTGDNQMCYSYSGKALYVMQPNQESVDAIKAAIDALEAGKTLDDVVTTE